MLLMDKTLLYQLCETSPFMMSFVIVTKKNNCIVIDGGREEDMPKLKEYVDGRNISAWILTHPHSDHIGGIMSEIRKNRLADFKVEKIYYNFPPFELIDKTEDVPDIKYYRSEFDEVLREFVYDLEPQIKDKA